MTIKVRHQPKDPKQSLLQAAMPDFAALPANWSLFVELLRQRRYTSGDVDKCIGVSRKVLQDWVRAGILSQLYHGLGAGKGEARFSRWRLFSVMDMWGLAYFKRLRDEGIYIERLRQMKKAEEDQMFEGETLQLCFYDALSCWVHRQPFWLWTDLRGHFAHRSIRPHNRAIYFIQLGYVEGDAADLFLVTNLLPLMDKVLSLAGPLKMNLHKEGDLAVSIEGRVLRLEPLPHDKGI